MSYNTFCALRILTINLRWVNHGHLVEVEDDDYDIYTPLRTVPLLRHFSCFYFKKKLESCMKILLNYIIFIFTWTSLIILRSLRFKSADSNCSYWGSSFVCDGSQLLRNMILYRPPVHKREWTFSCAGAPSELGNITVSRYYYNNNVLIIIKFSNKTRNRGPDKSINKKLIQILKICWSDNIFIIVIQRRTKTCSIRKVLMLPRHTA